MSPLPGRRCLGDEISEYAAGRLDPHSARQWDLHLVACASCRDAVEQERRLQSAFSAVAPAIPPSLRSTLLSLAATVAASLPDEDGGGAVPRAPLGLAALSHPALPVVPPGAPAMHRSPLRSAVIATAVAGASAAAALGLGMTTAQTVTSGTPRPAAPVSTTSPGRLAAFSSGGIQQVGAPAAATYGRATPSSARFTIPSPGAESTP